MARQKPQPFTVKELQEIDRRLRRNESIAKLLTDFAGSKTSFNSRLAASGYEPYRSIRPIVPVEVVADTEDTSTQ